MPKVNGKKYPYTKAGIASANKAKAKKKMSPPKKKGSMKRKVGRRV